MYHITVLGFGPGRAENTNMYPTPVHWFRGSALEGLLVLALGLALYFLGLGLGLVLALGVALGLRGLG